MQQRGEGEGEDLLDADQITLETACEVCLVADAAVDRVREKFGPGIVDPAAAWRHAS